MTQKLEEKISGIILDNTDAHHHALMEEDSNLLLDDIIEPDALVNLNDDDFSVLTSDLTKLESTSCI
jgi:hypothetical protein